MEPLTPSARQKILARPGVTEADLEEYESLLSQRFAVGPSQASADPAGERRISELAAKLFGAGTADDTKQDLKAAKRAENLDTVLGLAADTARAELGDVDNKTVTASATLNVSVTEGETTEEAGHSASVTLGATSSTSTNAAK